MNNKRKMKECFGFKYDYEDNAVKIVKGIKTIKDGYGE